MTFRPDEVAEHYNVDDLGGTILRALAASGKDPESLTVDDLAPVDEFHIRGRSATEELAQWAALEPAHEVLDVGCGLGGTARYLASTVGCNVVGVDLTGEYCRVAEMLSARVGLAKRTRFQQANALTLPFPEGRFDVVWTEHVQMNIADKTTFYRELCRVLKPGGRLAFHDIFSAGEHELYFPVPWAAEASISHLVEVADLERELADVGLKPVVWEDKSDASAAFFRTVVSRIQSSGWMPLGLHLVMGDRAAEKFGNMLRNLEDGRIQVVQAVMAHAS